MNAIKFLIRQGDEKDRSALHDLLVSCDMEADLPPEEFIVVDIEGQIVGAARLEWENQSAYVRPILVHSSWRGMNIGLTLIRTLTEYQPIIHVVARGSAIGFYNKLGFVSMTWDQVPERYRQECETCPDLETCHPVAMILNKSTDDRNTKN